MGSNGLRSVTGGWTEGPGYHIASRSSIFPLSSAVVVTSFDFSNLSPALKRADHLLFYSLPYSSYNVSRIRLSTVAGLVCPLP